jgi:hypothetical protein
MASVPSPESGSRRAVVPHGFGTPSLASSPLGGWPPRSSGAAPTPRHRIAPEFASLEVHLAFRASPSVGRRLDAILPGGRTSRPVSGQKTRQRRDQTTAFLEVCSPIALLRRETTRSRRRSHLRLPAALGFHTPSATCSSRRSSRPGAAPLSDTAPPERTLLGFALQSLPLSGSCATSRFRRALLTLSPPRHYLGCPEEPRLSPTPWLWDLGAAKDRLQGLHPPRESLPSPGAIRLGFGSCSPGLRLSLGCSLSP